MVFGDDPRQGYVEGQSFYHPVMRFSFSIPEGWKVQNTPSQVALQAESGDAAVILQAEKTTVNVRQYAESKTQNIQGRILHDQMYRRINGLDSYIQYFDVTQQDQADLRVIMSCIRKDELIYSFYSLSTVDNFRKYEFQFGTVVGSFREINDPRYLNRQPERLRIIEAPGNQTLRTILQNHGIKEEDLPKFAILNGMEINQIPEARQRIKTAR
jgi:predicted Zn-dependent protease